MEKIMNRLALALAVSVFGMLLTGTAPAAETKTDLTRDVFVENSTTNFVLTVKAAQVTGKNKVGFDISAPAPGDYTVVCFIDGKPWRPAKFTSPGTFELSTRGMPPGSYRITLQLVDSQGRVGSATQTLELK
jgi:hypothetical protein